MTDGTVKISPHSVDRTSVFLRHYIRNLFTKLTNYIEKQLKKYEWTIYIYIYIFACVCVCARAHACACKNHYKPLNDQTGIQIFVYGS